MKKLLSFLLCFTFIGLYGHCLSGPGAPGHDELRQSRKRINILVSSDPGKFDVITFSVRMRARLSALFSGGKLYVVSASSSEAFVRKAKAILQNKHALIGNLWFDSHGHFAKRYSLIEIGKDEFSFKNIGDSSATRWLKSLSDFADGQTKIGLGSCYSGATYTAPAIGHFDSSKMNGDSLMIGFSRIFNNASVYGSESWVMSGPGVFASTYALSGYPPRRKFKDPFFQPVWERLGVWNYYDGQAKMLVAIKTVCLDGKGSIAVKDNAYLGLKGKKKKQEKKMKALRKGNYNLAFMYQYNS
jgi:hypothetical protein